MPGVAYWFAKTLHFYLKVPVGIVNNARGGSVAYAWCKRERLDSIQDEKFQKILKNSDARTSQWETEAGRQAALARHKKDFDERCIPQWEQSVAKAGKEGRKPPQRPVFEPPRDARKGHSEPSGMYNGVVAPIGKLAVRGMIWYQGENNTFSRWTQHQYAFPHVIPTFREAFGDPELPVGVFDLAGCGDPETSVEKSCMLSGWAIVRDTLTKYTEKDPHSWLIPTYDVGHMNIHPLDKLPVGMRGARWALSRVYGEKNICHRGPKFKEMKIDGNKALITFETDPNMWSWQYDKDNTYTPVTSQGLSREANIRGFAIAGADRRWYPAKARRDEKNRRMEVWSDLVPDPVAVRYGWAANPDANLAHEWYDNLPVPTFRTDDWPVPGAFGSEYDAEYENAMRSISHYFNLMAEAEEADRKIRQAFVDIEENARERFNRNPEIKKQLEELQSLKERMEATLAREVKAVHELRLGNTGHGIEGKIPGYTEEFNLEEFRK